MNVKKIIIYSLGVFFAISLLGNGAQYFGTRRNNKLLDEYRTTVDELGRKLEAEEARNIRLAELNNGITERLGDSINRAGRAEEALGKIATGISGDVTTVQQIIEAVRAVREALEEYYYST